MRYRNPFILLVAACVLLQITTSRAADCVALVAGAPNAVTLRAAPNADASEAGKLNPGESLPFAASLPRWYEIRLSDGQSAYAAKRSTILAPCPTARSGVVATGPAFEIHAIDVGTGLSIFVRGPGFTLLYDAGSNDDVALGENNRAVAYLKALTPAVTALDHVILSHPHRDHVELLPDIVKLYKPHDVWNSGAYNDICGYRNFLVAIAEIPTIRYHTATQDGGTESITLSRKTCYGQPQAAHTISLKHAERISEEKIRLGSDASMTFLYADGSKHSSPNENSLVVRLDLGNRRILFMGDAEAGGRANPQETPTNQSVEGKLLACCAADLAADVLVVGHHGSKTSSRSSFLDKVGAKTFIVSAGPTKYATVILPDDEVIVALERRGEVLRTDLEDEECARAPEKTGPDNDGKPGGCDNVFLRISPGGIEIAK